MISTTDEYDCFYKSFSVSLKNDRNSYIDSALYNYCMSFHSLDSIT